MPTYFNELFATKFHFTDFNLRSLICSIWAGVPQALIAREEDLRTRRRLAADMVDFCFHITIPDNHVIGRTTSEFKFLFVNVLAAHGLLTLRLFRSKP